MNLALLSLVVTLLNDLLCEQLGILFTHSQHLLSLITCFVDILLSSGKHWNPKLNVMALIRCYNRTDCTICNEQNWIGSRLYRLANPKSRGWHLMKAFFFFFFFFLVFRDRVSLYSPGCPGTHFVDQAGLELRNPPASASQVLGLKACATTPGLMKAFLLCVMAQRQKKGTEKKRAELNLL
jgi:hypothetical protein